MKVKNNRNQFYCEVYFSSKAWWDCERFHVFERPINNRIGLKQRVPILVTAGKYVILSRFLLIITCVPLFKNTEKDFILN